MRTTLVIILSMFMAGCTPWIRTEYQKVYIPILYCPAPPTLALPEFYASRLTDEQKSDIGELTKAYVVSAQQSMNYIANLQTVYDLYVDVAKKSEDRLKAIEELGGEVDRSLIDQADKELKSVMSSIRHEIEYQNKVQTDEMLRSLNYLD